MRRMFAALAVLLVLSGCATPASVTTPLEPAMIEISLSDGMVSPNGDRVDLALGQTFVLTITADHDDQVHVHGFDTTVDVPAGSTVVIELVADRVGRYEVESHDPAMIIVVLQIR